MGLDLLVSEVQNMKLKVSRVSKNITTVAEVTQGDVVLFESDAIKKNKRPRRRSPSRP